MTAEKRSSLDGEIKQVFREMEDRKRKAGLSGIKIAAWRFTVRSSYFLKRVFDILFSLLALTILSPLCLLVALLIKISSPGPVFFVHTRVGKYGRHFRFYKFRSMYIDAEKRKAALMSQNQSSDGVIFKMKNDPRITPIGRILRRTSFDEVPQFLNVLFGDMSLVGPRPPVPKEVQEYTLEDRKRLDVIPGITCLWQIKGRSEIPFHEQVRLDKEYIIAPGFWKDVKILLKTIPAIIGGQGAY